MIRFCGTCGSTGITRLKKSGVYQCAECGSLTRDTAPQKEEEPDGTEGPVPNTTIAHHYGIPYIDTITYIVDDPKAPDRRVVSLPKPPRERSQIEYHDLPKAEQYWRRPVTPWFWSRKFIQVIAESRWTTGSGKKAISNTRWWEEEYDPKDPRWGPLTEAECRLSRAPKSAVGTFPFVEMTQYAAREWDRRLNGYWFFNNGIATYLTGANYYYLAHFVLELGEPAEFRYHHWKIWNFVEYEVKADRRCLGVVHPKFRREGATGLALCDMLELTTREKYRKGGIVSKVEDDAVKAMQRVNTSKNNIIPFFEPLTSDHTKNPDEKISFRTPKQRNSAMAKTYDEDEAGLNSEIVITATTNNPFDGDKKHIILADEFGKITKQNVRRMWSVMKECLRQGARRSGYAWMVSSVDEMLKGGGELFFDINSKSAQNTETEISCSESGLKRLFIPCVEGLEGFIDIYGVSIIDPPTPAQVAHLKERWPDATGIEKGALAWVLDKHRGGNEEKRLYPLTYMGCFLYDSAGGVFPEVALNEQIQWLKGQPASAAYARGSLSRRDGEHMWNGPVDFLHNTEGDWVFRFPPSFFEQHANRVLKAGFTPERLYRPQNGQFIVCVDPQRIGGELTRNRSRTSVAVFWMHDPILDPISKPTADWQSYSFVGFMCKRYMDEVDMYREVAKVCWMFGCEMLVELNAAHYMLKTFNEHGLKDFTAESIDGLKAENLTKDFVPERPNEAKGQFMGGNQYGKTAYVMAGAINRYISDHLHRMWHIPTLESWLGFDPDDTEKSDETISSGLCLLHATLRRSVTSSAPVSGVSLDFPKFDAYTGDYL